MRVYKHVGGSIDTVGCVCPGDVFQACLCVFSIG